MVLLAAAYERSGSIELAEKQYADATRVSDFDAGIGLNYVAFLRRRGNIERAEDILTQLAGRWPNNVGSAHDAGGCKIGAPKLDWRARDCRDDPTDWR